MQISDLQAKCKDGIRQIAWIEHLAQESHCCVVHQKALIMQISFKVWFESGQKLIGSWEVFFFCKKR